MGRELEHDGIVDEIVKGGVNVRITSVSACDGCNSKSSCSIEKSPDKIIYIPLDTHQLEVGRKVIVCIATSQGFWAVLYAYLLPIIILLTTLIVIFTITESEIYAGLSSIGATGVYFALLPLFKKRLDNEFTFHLKH